MNSIKPVTESYNKALKMVVDCLETVKENAPKKKGKK